MGKFVIIPRRPICHSIREETVVQMLSLYALLPVQHEFGGSVFTHLIFLIRGPALFTSVHGGSCSDARNCFQLIFLVVLSPNLDLKKCSNIISITLHGLVVRYGILNGSNEFLEIFKSKVNKTI